MTTQHSIRILSPAKLNLFLHITGRRQDGYHELQTLFQLLDYGDTLTYTLRDDEEIRIDPAIEGLSLSDNLIYKAALALKGHAKHPTGVHIHLEKRIPMGGGLGGGSSNAASTLLVLNQLWQCHLSEDDLANIGAKLGADVPVFVRGRSAWAEGIGEQLKPIDLPEKWYLVVKPDCHVDTGEIFSSEELTRDTLAITVAAFLEQGGQNDCEAVVCKCYPEVKLALVWLNKHAPARLTGTGACVFCEFDSELKAKMLQAEMPKNWLSFVARGINYSPLLSSVNTEK